jgi:hypothetical protein
VENRKCLLEIIDIPDETFSTQDMLQSALGPVWRRGRPRKQTTEIVGGLETGSLLTTRLDQLESNKSQKRKRGQPTQKKLLRLTLFDAPILWDITEEALEHGKWRGSNGQARLTRLKTESVNLNPENESSPG